MGELAKEDIIYSILKVSNKLLPNETIVEDCAKFDNRLYGYRLVIPKDRFTSLNMYLLDAFPKYKDIINEAFEDNSEVRIVQCCRTLQPNGFTPIFIEKYGGIQELMDKGPNGELPETKKVVEVEEEDPEMIKELEEKLLEKEKEIESLRNKLEVQEDVNNKIKEFEEIIAMYEKEKAYQDSKYPTDELSDDIIDVVVNFVQEDPNTAQQILLGMIVKNAEEEDERELSRLFNAIGTQLELLGVI